MVIFWAVFNKEFHKEIQKSTLQKFFFSFKQNKFV